MAWWELPYAGGPMVDVPGFPRPLYPPDAAAHGKQPSIDGPDVIAYKRTVSRLGRWPWQHFDDAYSNGFAHGKPPGNVSDSGVAGVQRQAKISPDSGWIGKQTFNLLRSARVPEGLPHAGEMAMDATSQSLLVDAWNEFHGAPTPPSHNSSGYFRLQQARFYIGVEESPPASNLTEFGEWYGMNGEPWCAIFVTYCDQAHSEKPSKSFRRGERYAYVPYIVADARHDSHGLSITNAPEPGDLVCYDWEGNGEFDHIGIFEGWVEGSNKKKFTAIEGNTSIESNSNGGEVMRRTRDLSCALFVDVAESWDYAG
jgi:hypothetical protein